MHGEASSLSEASALALRPDFALGTALVRPALRQVTGPLATVTLEPKVMQVLVALADAGGQVLTRADLVAACWGVRFVADDAVNRAVSEVRRATRTAGGFAVETVPKVGWRIAVDAAPEPVDPPDPPTFGRRSLLLAGGGAALAALGVTVTWPRRSAEVAALIERARIDLRDDLPDGHAQGIGFLTTAVKLAPGDSLAWGRLALAWRNVAEYGEHPTATRQAESAARRALAIEAGQPDAALALATLASDFGNWFPVQHQLDTILARHPDHQETRGARALLDMKAGRVAADVAALERLVAEEPLSPVWTFRLVYGRWAVGRLAEMDQLADRARELWPRHPAVWLARALTLGYTGRTAAAQRLLDAPGGPPRQSRFGRQLQAIWATLGDGQERELRVSEALAAAAASPSTAVLGMQHLAMLGAVDAAFTVARGYLLRRGLDVRLDRRPGEPPVNDQFRRKTMMLWLPSTAAMRADARFLPMLREIGMTRYWRQSGRGPDWLGNRPFPV